MYKFIFILMISYNEIRKYNIISFYVWLLQTKLEICLSAYAYACLHTFITNDDIFKPSKSENELWLAPKNLYPIH